MSDELRQVDDAALDQPDCPWPCIAVSVLKLEVDLLSTQPHERHVHFVFAHPNHENLAPKFDTPNGRSDTALDTRAFQSNGQPDATSGIDDVVSSLFRSHTSLDLVCSDAWNKLFGKFEPSLIDVGDDDRPSTCGSAAKESHQTDRTCTTDQDRVSKSDSTPFHTGQRDAERLQHCPVLETHFANLVTPHCWVVEVSSEQTIEWWRRGELHVYAPVVATGQTGLALVANDVGLNGNSIADLQVRDGWMSGNHHACGLVPEYVVILDYHRANGACVPEVDIGSETSWYQCMGFPIWVRNRTDPQIPVLLIPTVTSPSFNPSPFLTSSRLGLESAIQRS